MTASRDEPAPEAVAPPRAGRSRATLVAEVGELVRKARAKRGVTRKALAELSGTSERYLAQIESGSGNPSVLVLDAVAHGLGLSLADLLPLDVENATRRRAIEGLIRAPLPQVEVILHLLDGTRGSAAAGTRGRRLALVGLRGAGKSTLGAALAERLTCPFIELDQVIESDRGAPVAMLIEVYGLATFRRYERDSLEKLIAVYPEAVIAIAGGIVADEKNYARLLQRTHSRVAARLAGRSHAPGDGTARLPADGQQPGGDGRPRRHPRGAQGRLRPLGGSAHDLEITPRLDRPNSALS